MLVGFVFRGICKGALPSLASGRGDLKDQTPLVVSTAVIITLIKPKKLTVICLLIWLSDSSSKGLLYPVLLTITSTQPNLLGAVAKADWISLGSAMSSLTAW